MTRLITIVTASITATTFAVVAACTPATPPTPAEPGRLAPPVAWHRLAPWPARGPGRLRLKRAYIIGPLSNGATQLLVNMAKRAGIPWDLILSSDITRAYKRDPRAYQAAIAALGMELGEVLLRAAHNADRRRVGGRWGAGGRLWRARVRLRRGPRRPRRPRRRARRTWARWAPP